ncbi:O-methyltransferase [Rhynchospora pubera]|uniref:O-methyltransferase n=1 Tax=Rhynchospora pubera TaxID=906938 RepID=A0AAV8ERW1_9POAL|nr:O-methyltransferase [Rhynchospora pubera]KAJ4780827.1 O-methyltransferase [Rhynchospora pubera]
MEKSTIVGESSALLDAQAELWNHIFSFLKSMCLKCAVELGIPDAIQCHGDTISSSELITALSIQPSKADYLRRMMRALVHSGFFSVDRVNGEEVYGLTPLSRLLITDGNQSLSPFVKAMLHPILVQPSLSMSSWFKSEISTEHVPFALVHGTDLWGVAGSNPEFSQAFNDAMACDGQFIMDKLLKDHRAIFQGIESLVDVGGGTGGTVRAISKAFPEMKCAVLDLPHVVGNLKSEGNVEFVAGDMFNHVPPADAVLLKWILHGWGDEDCVKILRRCKEAIPSKENGGKIIIMDLVVGSKGETKSKETQLMWDMMMMVVVGSPERDEQEWRKIFVEAGFGDYKILPVGLRSVIELYP